MRAAGVRPGAYVGVGTSRHSDTIVAILAVVASGAAYVPLDPDYPDDRLRAMLAGAGVEVVVGAGDRGGKLEALGVTVLDVPTRAGPGPPVDGRDLPGREAGLDDAAYVMFTSGSTGRPKGLVIPHRGVVRLVLGADYVELGPDETVLLFAPLTFDASTLEIWGPLLNGGRLAIAPDGPFDVDELAAAIARHGVTTLWLTAGAFHQVVETDLDALRGVRQLLAGGDVLLPRAVQRVLDELPGCRLVNGYGPTENTTFTTCHAVDAGERVTSVPIGRPIHGTHVVVVDERLQPAPLGVRGELCIGGDGLAWGYLGDPRLTAERFVPDPFVAAPGSRMYRSGDLVAWRAGGELEFSGRIDRQLKVRGFRVEPAEIEAVLEEHPLVESAVVVGRDDRDHGRRLVAYVVADRSAEQHATGLAGADDLVEQWQRSYERLYRRLRTATRGVTSGVGRAARPATRSRTRRWASGWTPRWSGSCGDAHAGCSRSVPAPASSCSASPPRSSATWRRTSRRRRSTGCAPRSPSTASTAPSTSGAGPPTTSPTCPPASSTSSCSTRSCSTSPASGTSTT